MKLLAKFNGCLACLFLIVFLGAMGSNPVIAADVCVKKRYLPKCDPPTDPPPNPDPEPDPEQTIPAFAYYCKNNPNSGAICLANEDGSNPTKIFTTQKFHGDDFEISAFQSDGSGSVLVEDYGVLSQIDYFLTAEGVLQTVQDPETLLSEIADMDWNPSGDDFAFVDHASPPNVYLGSRAIDSTDQRGEAIVLGPNSPYPYWDFTHFRALTWSEDGSALFFIKHYSTTDGPWWDEVHMADISAGGTQEDTECLLATREAQKANVDYCTMIDPNLTNLYEVSHQNPRLMVAARGRDASGQSSDEIYYVYLLEDGSSWTPVPTPEFKGFDWTSDGTIIGQTDDDEIIVFNPDTGNVSVLLKKNATSPDWTN